MAELKISEEARRAALRRALRGGGKAKVSLTAGQRSALRKLGLIRPQPQDAASRPAATSTIPY